MSVLVTAYNHARFVEEALDSLAAQTATDFEVVVVDDASTDGTADVIERWLRRTGWDVPFIRNEQNRGICANRNAGLAATTGELVCSLAGDDAYEPERIAAQARCFAAAATDVAVVYSDMRRVDEHGSDLGATFLERMCGGEEPPREGLFDEILRRNFMPAPAAMIRRSAIEAVGGYDESLAYEDFDMWLKLSDRFRFRYLPGCLVRYRELADSMTRGPQWQVPVARSERQILRSWALRRPDARPEICDRLWRSARPQLRSGDEEGLAETLALLAEIEPRAHRRVAARIAGHRTGRRPLALVLAARSRWRRSGPTPRRQR